MIWGEHYSYDGNTLWRGWRKLNSLGFGPTPREGLSRTQLARRCLIPGCSCGALRRCRVGRWRRRARQESLRPRADRSARRVGARPAVSQRAPKSGEMLGSSTIRRLCPKCLKHDSVSRRASTGARGVEVASSAQSQQTAVEVCPNLLSTCAGTLPKPKQAHLHGWSSDKVAEIRAVARLKPLRPCGPGAPKCLIDKEGGASRGGLIKLDRFVRAP